MYIKKKNKLNKLSRKHNVSEILNSTNKTKKQYDARKHKLQAQKQKRGKNHNQEGGFPKFGKDPFNNTYDVSKSTESFDVANKVQYNRLKRDIRNTIFFSWINKKTGTITETAYELLKRLLKANLFFAKMKLENVKMLYNLDKLIKDKDSGLKTVQSIIDQIFELQRQIKNFYDPNKEGLKKQGIINKFTKLFKKKNDTIESLIHKQDKLRMKLMEYTMFTDSEDLSSKCDYSFGGLIGKALFKERSHRTTKKIICLLGKYRKNEGKFNRYYNLFHRQYEKFIVAYPSCVGMITNSTLLMLDITDDTKTPSIFEDVKCDKERIAKIYDDATNAAIKTSEKQLPNDKLQKSITKDKEISDEYKKKGGKFKELIESFNKRLLIFKKLFSAAELYGIHHYKANIPKNKKLFKAFRSEDPLLKTNKLAKLAEEPVFINKFISIIDDLAKRAEPIFDKTKQYRKITDEVIPYIKIYDDVFANLKILTINIDNIDKTKNKDINTILNIACLDENSNITSAPDIICIQNGTQKIATDIKNKININGNSYIPISYSLLSENKYNIILIDESIIIDRNSEKQPLDQSTYFILNYTPNGMKLKDVQKSFAAVNLIESGIKKGILKKASTSMIGGTGESGKACEDEFKEYLTADKNSKSFRNDAKPHRIKKWKDDIIKYWEEVKTKNDKSKIEFPYYNSYNDLNTDDDDDDDEIELSNCFKILGYMLLFNKVNNIDNTKIEKLIKNYVNFKLDFKPLSFNINKNKNENLKGNSSKAKKNMRSGRSKTYPNTIYEQIMLQSDIGKVSGEDILEFMKISMENIDNNNNRAKNKRAKNIFEKLFLKDHDIISQYDISSIEDIKKLLKNIIGIWIPDKTRINYEINNIMNTIIKPNIKYFEKCDENCNDEDCEGEDCEECNNINKECEEQKKQNRKHNIYNKLNKLYPRAQIDDETFFILKQDMPNNKKNLINIMYKINKQISIIETLNKIIDKLNKNRLDLDLKLKFKDDCIINKNKIHFIKNFDTDTNEYTDDLNFIQIEYINLMELNKSKDITIKELQKFKTYDEQINNCYENILDKFIEDNKNNEKYKNFLLKYKTSTNDNNSEHSGGGKTSKCLQYVYYNIVLGILECFNDCSIRSNRKNIYDNDNILITNFFNKNNDKILKYGDFLNRYNNFFTDKTIETFKNNNEIENFSDTYNPPTADTTAHSPGTPLATTSRGITIVTTELIGSNPEKDLKEHLIDINNFSIDGSPNIQGLRQAQINKIFEVINLYTGRNPDIICGDFGGTLAIINKDILYYNVKRFIVNKDSITDVEDILELYYKNGMTELSGRMNNYEPHTSTPPTPKIEMTNSLDGMITNYIFHNIQHTNVKQFGPQDNTNINDFGGILPIGVELKFDISKLKDLQLTSPDQFIRKKGDSTIKTQLYTKAELTDILKVLDELMGNFGYGYKPFLKRDLGCFNIGDDSKYGKRIFNENTEDLQTFYSMNYPSFIETYLYQLSGFFNESSTANIFYNENQITMKDTFTSRHSLNIFDDIKSKYRDNKIGMDIIIRMLLIPSDHLKAISGIDIIDKTSAVDFEGLSQKFCTQYYRDVVQIALEKRITELMAGTSGTPNVNYNFISKLKERNEEGHLTNIKDHSQSYTLITNLFEFIFIMLKLKYIDKQLESIGGGISGSPSGVGGVARPGSLGSSSSGTNSNEEGEGEGENEDEDSNKNTVELSASSDKSKTKEEQSFNDLYKSYTHLTNKIKLEKNPSQKLNKTKELKQLTDLIKARLAEKKESVETMEKSVTDAQAHLLTLSGERKIVLNNAIQELKAKIKLTKIFGGGEDDEEEAEEEAEEALATQQYKFNVLTYNVYYNAIMADKTKGHHNLKQTCKGDKCINNIVDKIVNTEQNTFRDFPTLLEYDFIALQESSNEHQTLLDKIKAKDTVDKIYDNLIFIESPRKEFITKYNSNNPILRDNQSSNIVTYYDINKYKLDKDGNNILEGILNENEYNPPSLLGAEKKVYIRPILFLFLTNTETGNQVCVINLWNKHNKDDRGKNIKITSLDFSDSNDGLPGKTPAPAETQIINLNNLIQNYVQENDVTNHVPAPPYISPATQQKIDAFKNKFKDKRRNIILMGDFNADVKQVTIYNRQLKINFIKNDPTCCDESLENPGNITNNKLYIDKIFVSENYNIENTVGQYSKLASDHLPVLGNINIETLIIPKIENTPDNNYYQVQNFGLLSCGRNALNNLLGGEYFSYNKGKEVNDKTMKFAYGSDTNSQLDLTSLCKYLDGKYPNKSKNPLCNNGEDYDIVVLMAALDILGYSCDPVNKDALDNKCSDSKIFIGYLVNYGGGNHWVAVVKNKDNDNFILRDSTNSNKTSLTIQNVKDLPRATHFFKVCFTGQYVVDIASTNPYKDTKLVIKDKEEQELVNYKIAKYDILNTNVKTFDENKFAEIIEGLFAAETKEKVDKLITSEIQKYNQLQLLPKLGGSLQHNNSIPKTKSKKHKKNTKSNQRKSIQKNHKKSKTRIN